MSKSAKSPQQRNVEPVLSLGATRYVTIQRLGTYAIPPVSFRAGQRVLSLYSDALELAQEAAQYGKKETQIKYFAKLGALARVLWQHIRPVKSSHKLLWRMGLMRNPFMQCSEQELREIISFFLQGRMKSSVQSTWDLESHA